MILLELRALISLDVDTSHLNTESSYTVDTELSYTVDTSHLNTELSYIVATYHLNIE